MLYYTPKECPMFNGLIFIMHTTETPRCSLEDCNTEPLMSMNIVITGCIHKQAIQIHNEIQ